jgi:hypothetical protein
MTGLDAIAIAAARSEISLRGLAGKAISREG